MHVSDSLVTTMRTPKLSRCCFVFTPRQCTMMVAIVELCLTFIVLCLLLLAAMNAQEIAAMVSSEFQALENSWSQEFGEKYNMPLHYINNEKRMLTGQHLASIMMTMSYVGVVVSVFHILSCLMLLYGAIHDIPHFLLPWLSTVLISIVLAASLLLYFIFVLPHKCALMSYVETESRVSLAAAGVIALALEIYTWMSVFTYYREISRKTIYGDIAKINPTHIIYDSKSGTNIDL